MRAVDIIEKKKRGLKLDREEIAFLVGGYVDGKIPDYQMAAWMMAVYFQDLDHEETTALVELMRDSGDLIPLTGVQGPTVDKHSTGGVGDKTTLALAPLVASCGLKVAKMTGRGLGHTGGTLDKFEAIEGFRPTLPNDVFKANVNRDGLAVVGQTANLVPADKKMYALRDVTATVDHVALIAGSIMSKKLAVANDALVLDVKVGSGAFMKTLDDARRLARLMVRIGKNLGRKVRAVITNMDQPLGIAVGNALEVQEAIDTLKGHGPEDFVDLVLELGAHLLVMCKKAPNDAKAKALLRSKIESGEAYERFERFVVAQGGKLESLDRLPSVKKKHALVADRDGYVHGMDAEAVGLAAMKLGAGRETKEQEIDLAVGITMAAKVGDRVKKGDPLCHLHYRSKKTLDAALKQLEGCFRIQKAKVSRPPVVIDVVK